MFRKTVIASLVLLCSPPAAILAQQASDSPLDDLLNTRISSAAKYEQRISEVPASVTIISAEEISRYGFQTVAEALRTIRGLYMTYDRNYTYLGVRGFSRPVDYNNRLLVLLNGHSLNEGVFGSTPLGSDLPIDLENIERIEFIRGPSSVVYGTGAMFGVINVITKTADQSAGAFATIGAGSLGEQRASIRGGADIKGTEMTVSGFVRRQAGKDLYFPEFDSTNGGIAHNLDFDRSYGALLTLRRGRLKATALYGSRTKGIPTAPYETSFNEYSDTVDRRALLDLSYERTFGVGQQVAARASWDRYQYYGAYPLDTVLYDASLGVKRTAELRWVWDPQSRSRLIVGAEATDHSRAQYRYTDQGEFDVDLPFRIISAYAQEEYALSQSVSVTGGLRYDHYSNANGTRHDWLTPRVALLITPAEKTTVKVMYGEAFRAPAAYEVQYEETGAGHSSGLLPETIHSAEVSVERRFSEELLASLSVYGFRAERLIEQRTFDDGLLLYVNAEEATAAGVELEANYRTRTGVWTYGSMSHQRARQDGGWMSNSPRNLAKAGISTPTSRKVQAACDVIYETGRRSVFGASTSAYALTNLKLAYRFTPQARLSLAIGNLFDVAYAAPGGLEHRQAIIRQDGRTFSLSFTVGTAR